MSRRTKWQGLKCSQIQTVATFLWGDRQTECIFLTHPGSPRQHLYTARSTNTHSCFKTTKMHFLSSPCVCVCAKQSEIIIQQWLESWLEIPLILQMYHCIWPNCMMWVNAMLSINLPLVLYKETQYSEQLAEKVYSLIFFFERGCKSKKKWNIKAGKGKNKSSLKDKL